MTSLVLDASAAMELLLGHSRADTLASLIRGRTLWAPDLITAELVSVLRGLDLSKNISSAEAEQALDEFEGLRIRRVEMLPLARGAWTLRHNVSAYDAMYVTLAQSLGCHVLTCDLKLARTVGDIALTPG